MKKTRFFLLVLCFAIIACVGCSKKQSETTTEEQTTEINTASGTDATAEDATNHVASADEMATPQDVVDEDMVPIYGDSLKDGVYSITVDSSSSMFNITACELTVENGEMTAVMTMGGTGYLYVYMGTGEEAASASSDDYISYVENENDEHTFTVPVEALDIGIDCAAFSKNKEKWYDRVLVFRADSLSQDAFAEGTITTAEDIGLADGVYEIQVTLEGGSGKAYVESPAGITVENGIVTATIIWSSANYDYMVVDGEKYLPINTEGNSTFEIPVSGFDWPLNVKADTTAMSTPHEIDYTLYFDSGTIEPVR